MSHQQPTPYAISLALATARAQVGGKALVGHPARIVHR